MSSIKNTNANHIVSGLSLFLADHSFRLPVEESQLQSYIARYFEGGIVNYSEQKKAWHMQFRDPSPCELVQDAFREMKRIAHIIRSQQWHFEIKDIINIGIGGSDLGPKLICEAFGDEDTIPRMHFVSNLDTTEIKMLLKKISAKNTLFISTSKSFRTLETLENTLVAKVWLENHGCNCAEHMIAITSNATLAADLLRLPPSHILFIPDWVGGRYSIWSTVGLSCAITLGFERFYELHQGAYEMDYYFQHTPIHKNKIIQYASLLHHALLHQEMKTLAILPYAHNLKTLPDYLQQLMMESLGKNVTINGECVKTPTGPIVFGNVGSHAQHSFQQMLMQGTHPIFVDFILPLSQPKVVANCVTQVKTLREGVADDNVLKKIPGGKIANLFVLDELNLKTLGAMLAFYEHVVVTLAYFLDINPFDQFGVEHAKRESDRLFHQYGPAIANVDQIAEILELTVPDASINMSNP